MHRSKIMRQLGLTLLLYLGLIGLAQAQSPTQCLVPPNAAATPVESTALEGGHILKAAPGCLLGVYVTVDSTTTGYLLTFNTTTVPADGAVTPIECIYIATNPGSVFINFSPQPPEWYNVGIVAVFSSSGCFTKTASAHAFFHAIVQ